MKLKQRLNWSEQYDRARSFIRAARLSLFETVFLVSAITFALVAAFFYLTKIPPRQFELRDLEQRETAALTKLSKLARERQRLDEQRGNAEKIVGSLADFEARLRSERQGKIEVIDEVNRLARGNRVKATGFAYRLVQSDEAGEAGAVLATAGAGRREANVYPVLGIDTTVVGDYRDLRRFISDLERSSRFVIINGVAFQGEAEQNQAAPVPAAPAPSAGRVPTAPGQVAAPAQTPPQPAAAPAPGAVPVSLKIEMETYFQREAPAPPPVGAPGPKS